MKIKLIIVFLIIYCVVSAQAQNLALNASTNAESWKDATHSPSAAVDGNETSYWSSGAPAPRWWVVDLGQPYFLDSIWIRLRGDSNPLCYGHSCYDFQMWASLDSLNWIMIGEEFSTVEATYSFSDIDDVYEHVKVIFTNSDNWASWCDIVEVEVYGSDTSFINEDSLIEVTSLPIPLSHHVAYSYNQYIYCFGGVSGPGAEYLEYRVFRYNPQYDNWEIYDTLSFHIWSAYSCKVDSEIYFAGGVDEFGSGLTNKAYSYNLESKSETILQSLPLSTYAGKGFNDFNQFHIFGGHNGIPNNISYIYDNNLDVWIQDGTFYTSIERFNLAEADSLIYIIGGRKSGTGAESTLVIFNKFERTYDTLSNLDIAVKDLACTAFLDGNIYVFGGRTTNSTLTNKVQVYNPKDDTWASGPDLPNNIAFSVAVSHSGAIYLIGGDSLDNFTNKVYKYVPWNCIDTDNDGYGDPEYLNNECTIDNCPFVYNPMQKDADSNGVGDACCCIGYTGNTNCSENEEPDISDIVRIIDCLYISHESLCCPKEADCNGSGHIEPDISDITALIDYLYIDHSPTAICE